MTEPENGNVTQDSGEMIPTKARISEGERRNIASFEDAFRLVQQVYGTDALIESDTLGDGFEVLDVKGKARLVGKPFIIIDASFSVDKTTDNPYVVARVVTQDDAKYIITDGSLGVYKTLFELKEENGEFRPVFAKAGLSVSEYDYTDPATGKKSLAKTYYINTTPLQ